MRAAFFSLILASLVSTGWAEADPTVVATGDWSKPVGDTVGYQIRGRLLICQGGKLGKSSMPATIVYLELQNAKEAVSDPIDVYVDPNSALQCQMRDGDDKPMAITVGPYSGPVRTAQWIALPHEATIRLRMNPYGIGGEGLAIRTGNLQGWDIPPGHTGSLKATFTSNPPPGEGRQHVWKGTLELPAFNITAPK